MHRFYFDFRQGSEVVPDEEGCELASAEDAYLEAFKAAQEMWGALLAERSDPRRCAFDVRDAYGHLLFVLPFQELLDSCRDGAVAPHHCDPLRQAAANVHHAMRLKGELGREIDKARKNLRAMHKFLSLL
jgi:hypothetical protein